MGALGPLWVAKKSILSTQKEGGILLRRLRARGGVPDPQPQQSPPHPSIASARPERERVVQEGGGVGGFGPG